MLAKQASGSEKDRGSYGLEWRGAAGISGETPFWIHSNRHGDFDRYSANTTLNMFGSRRHELDFGLQLEAGGNLLFRGADDATVWFQEAYVQASYRGFYLRGGRKREDLGMVPRDLSMGTVDLSHNARPMPKIIAGTKEFMHVPGTSGVLHVDAALAHGWMRDSEFRRVQDPYLHQKHLYIRFFSEYAPVVILGGIKHFTQWGGESPRHGPLPSDFAAYWDVFFSRTPNSVEILSGGRLNNAFQNHVGSYDFALMFNHDRYRLKLSRQFILEDTPNARFGTPFDGMWGATLELRPDVFTSWRSKPDRERPTAHRPLLEAVHYAYLDTKEGIDRYEYRDINTYFNYYGHRIYQGGWTYQGRAIGNPLFFSDPDYISVVNNVLIAHHFGANGYIGPVDWKFYTTYSRNYGATTYRPREGVEADPMNSRRDQWSFLLETHADILHPSVELGLALAIDAGEVYNTNPGLMLSVRWTR